MEYNYDVIIVGAGPAGCSCAINLAESDLKILIIEKSTFPRDKICGGGLSERSVNTLKRMPDGIYNDFLQEVDKVDSKGVRLFSPNQRYFDVIPKKAETNGFICKRKDFDYFLLRKVQQYKNIDLITAKIESVEITENCAILKTDQKSFITKVVIGGDGANSIISKQLTSNFHIRHNKIVAIRAYYKNISGFDDRSLGELHFLKEIIPGYFWIFPLGNNEFNVGIGSSRLLLKKKKTILKQLMNDLINHNPIISERFKNADLISRVEADSLPIGGEKYQISGNRFLLIGDAASLIDPFTGEGIGNALLSGEIASKIIKQSFLFNDFSNNQLKKYDLAIKKRLDKEFRIHRFMFFVTRNSKIINYLMNKANDSKYFQELIQKMLDNNQLKWAFFNPIFYLKLLFKK